MNRKRAPGVVGEVESNRHRGLAATGRGRHYSRLRGLSEAFFRTAYLGDWPARMWGRLDRGADVTLFTLRQPAASTIG
jgi:hypothetical protein